MAGENLAENEKPDLSFEEQEVLASQDGGATIDKRRRAGESWGGLSIDKLQDYQKTVVDVFDEVGKSDFLNLYNRSAIDEIMFSDQEEAAQKIQKLANGDAQAAKLLEIAYNKYQQERTGKNQQKSGLIASLKKNILGK